MDIGSYYPVGAQLVRAKSGKSHSVNRAVMPGYIFIFHDPRLQLDLFTRDPGYREHPTSMVDAEIADAVAFQARPTVHPVNGSLGFLQRSDGTGPVRVGEEIVDELKAREKAGDFDDTVKIGRAYVPRWARPGHRVRIVHGPWKAMGAHIAKIVTVRSNATLLIETAFMGQASVVSCPLAWCEKGV